VNLSQANGCTNSRAASSSTIFKRRRVPMWWGGGTLADLAAWRADRAARRATGRDPFVASLQVGREALVFSRHTFRKKFRTACRVLGKERLEHLTIHHGRHTSFSHALAVGRTLAEVRDAVGHSNVSITSGYLYVAVDECGVGKLFP
jgi:integrase